MAVVTCPKCPTKLRVADGATGNVKCPKCNTIFPAAAKPAFEVVEDEPKPAAKTAPATAKPGTGTAKAVTAPAAKPASQPAKTDDEDDDFAFDKKPKKKGRDDDDDDDRPRKKRRDDDDDDDDRPRGKRRRDDDDDDDDDDRPRKKKKRRRDDDDDDDDWRPAKKGNVFGTAATGAQLMTIGLWCYTGMFALLGLFMLIGMATSLPDGLFVLPGLAGVTMTVLTIVGASFCIAGPSRAKGMAIATVSVAAAHVVLVLVCYDKIGSGLGASLLGGIDWVFLGTAIWILDVVLPALIYAPKGADFGEGILFVLAGVCELARMILVCLTLKSLATAAKDHDSAQKAGMDVIVTCIVCGAAAAVALLVVVILDAAKLGRSSIYIAGLAATAICAGYAFMSFMVTLAANDTKNGLARRARKG